MSILINCFSLQNRGRACKVPAENDLRNDQTPDHVQELFGGAGWQGPKACLGAL